MNEIWKTIQGYENYQVSNLGRVKSVCYNKERILKTSTDRYGYVRVKIFNNSKGKTVRIHKLVAESFLENPRNCKEINHIDENKENNCVKNLEWCDHRENARYSKCIPIEQYHPIMHNKIKTWECANDAEKELGISHASIAACCKGKAYTAGGFVWCFQGNVPFFKK